MCVLPMCTGPVGFLAGSVTCAQDKQIGKTEGGSVCTIGSRVQTKPD